MHFTLYLREWADEWKRTNGEISVRYLLILAPWTESCVLRTTLQVITNNKIIISIEVQISLNKLYTSLYIIPILWCCDYRAITSLYFSRTCLWNTAQRSDKPCWQDRLRFPNTCTCACTHAVWYPLIYSHFKCYHSLCFQAWSYFNKAKFLWSTVSQLLSKFIVEYIKLF